MAVLHARGPGVVGLPGEVEPPAAMRPARGGDRYCSLAVDQVATLLHVELDERGHVVQQG